MKTLKFTMLLILLLLAIPNLVHARPEGVMVKEWKEVQLNSSKKQRVVSKLVPLESVSCEIRVLTLDPDFLVYFVEDTCLSWGLSRVPNELGTLYCKLGFWKELFPIGLPSIIPGISPNRIYGVFSAVSGKRGNLDGWEYCKDI